MSLKIDLGCGPNKREGFVGCDAIAFEGVDHVFDIGAARWPFEDGSVDEANATHFVEHLTSEKRVHFWNELFRVLKDGGTATIVTPHWNSNRAYGDFTHQWPPVSEMAYFYLNKQWRADNAPHTDAKFNPQGYDCHFDATWGYGMNPALLARNQEYQNYALSWFKEAALDLHATVTARK